ncbi:hypothetical protein Areg01_59000 [Actinoplanes regularis]|nr:hypothetical protein Areg01_59000 [Actinoplanes regularis]
MAGAVVRRAYGRVAGRDRAAGLRELRERWGVPAEWEARCCGDHRAVPCFYARRERVRVEADERGA